MIANITPTARSRSLYGALEYNKLKLDNGEAKAIFANNIIVPRNELDRLKLPYLQRCFQPYLDQNRRTKATVFHCSLNPHPNDRLDEQQLRIMAQEYMEQLGYGEQPYVVYLHKDIDREHLHIVSLRVKLDGTAISSSNERRRSKAITEELERKYGLHPAEESLRKNDIDNLKVIDYKRGDLKQQTASIVRTILEKYQFASVRELNTLFVPFNLSVTELTGETNGKHYEGIVYSVLNETGERIGRPIRSSDIGKDVGYKALKRKEAQGQKTIREDTALMNRLRQIIRSAVSPGITRESFEKALHTQNMDVIFRQNEQGRITGATFIDHTAGIVFNGSRLGKEYSANKFQELFTVPAPVGEKVHSESGPEHGQAGRQKNDLRPEQQQERKGGECPERQAESAPETHEQNWHLDLWEKAVDALNLFGTAFDDAEKYPDYEQQFEVQRKKKKKRGPRL